MRELGNGIGVAPGDKVLRRDDADPKNETRGVRQFDERAIVAVVGPTATGKSALAVALARELGGEVVNADAFALYRGMDIGTAKPVPAARADIPHHQIDVLDIHDDASVAVYQRHARADLDSITARGNVPIIVGGSGLYVRAALDLLDIPPTDPLIRSRLEGDVDHLGLPAVRERLRRVDPQAADIIEANNARRIVRALEVVELTGRPFSAAMPTREFRRPTVMLGLDLSREVLDERIGRRVRDMWGAGLLEEAAGLERRGLSRTRTASRAVGYREALAVLAGTMTGSEAIEATVAATKRLARRQRSWFRPDPRITWLPVSPAADSMTPVLEQAVTAVSAAGARGTIGP